MEIFSQQQDVQKNRTELSGQGWMLEMAAGYCNKEKEAEDF